MIFTGIKLLVELTLHNLSFKGKTLLPVNLVARTVRGL